MPTLFNRIKYTIQQICSVPACGLAIMLVGTIPSYAKGMQSISYDWVTHGNVSGSLVVKKDAFGTTTAWFEYHDRGRGPKTVTSYTVDKNNLITDFKVQGVNYYKGKVNESFTLKDSGAHWSSGSEPEHDNPSAPALYIPVNMMPEYRAVIVRALLRQPEKILPLLPKGQSKLTLQDRFRVTGEQGTHTLTLYGIEGLGILPEYVWLDENNNFFGYDLGWVSIVRSGWQQVLDDLKRRQARVQQSYMEHKSRQFTHAVKGDIVITDVQILDLEKGRLTTPVTVRIRQGKIAETVNGYKNRGEVGQYINGKGKVLMPALWDMHAHVGPDRYFTYIASGVLNVRDMANDPEYIEQAQKGIAAELIAAPDIHPMGFIDKKGPFSAPTGRLANTLDEALGFVDEYARRGYSGIKLYSSIESEWVPLLSARAREYGMTVAGHIPSGMTVKEAVKAGYDEVTHINMMLLQLIGDRSVDSRTPDRFVVPGRLAGNVDLQSGETLGFVNFLTENKVAHDPTIGIIFNIFRNRPGAPKPVAEPYIEHLPALLQRAEIASKGLNDGAEAAFNKASKVSLQLLKILHDAGVVILPGTDTTFPGFALVSELGYYAEAGISNIDLLKMATLGSARHMGKESELGSVAVGKKAHLILVNGNPIVDVRNLRNIELVIKGQRYFKPRDILLDLGFRPF